MTWEGARRRIVLAIARLPVRLRPSSQLAREGRHHGAIQKQRELAGLVREVRRRRPRTVVEVGTASGGTLYALCQASSPDALVVSVDIPWQEDSWGEHHAERIGAFARRGQRLALLRVDSHSPEALESVRRVLDGREVDVLFIDGDHSYDGVRKDYETFGPLVRPGGLIGLHDIVPHEQPECEVDRFWNELESRGLSTHEIVDDSGGPWGGVGLVEVRG